MKTIVFFRGGSGRSPVKEFLDSLPGKHAQKIAWVLRLVEEIDVIPEQYFKKLVDTDDIWEVRVQVGSDAYRLLGFFAERTFVVLTNGFAKKTQKIPQTEIKIAEQRKREYLSGAKK